MSQDSQERVRGKKVVRDEKKLVDLHGGLLLLGVVYEALSYTEKAVLAEKVEKVSKSAATARNKEQKKKVKRCLVPSVLRGEDHLADLDVKMRDLHTNWQYPDYKTGTTPSPLARMMATFYLIAEIEDEKTRTAYHSRLLRKLNDLFLQNKKKNAESRKKAAQGKKRRQDRAKELLLSRQTARPEKNGQSDNEPSVDTDQEPNDKDYEKTKNNSKRRRESQPVDDGRPSKKKKSEITHAIHDDDEDKRTESEQSKEEESEKDEPIVNTF